MRRYEEGKTYKTAPNVPDEFSHPVDASLWKLLCNAKIEHDQLTASDLPTIGKLVRLRDVLKGFSIEIHDLTPSNDHKIHELSTFGSFAQMVRDAKEELFGDPYFPLGA